MYKETKKGDFRFGGLFFIGAILLVVVVFLACSAEATTNQKQQKSINISTDTLPADTIGVAIDSLPPAKQTFRIIGVGDMMLGTNYPSKSYLPPNGGKDLLADVLPILKDADVTFGNLEGTILDEGGTAKRCNNPSLCYVFRSPESYVQHYVDAGFDMLSIANNHSGDFGPTGRTRTKAVLKKANIAYAGLAGTDETAIIERAGKKFGLAAFAPNSGTCDIRNISRAKKIVSTLAESCDIVIVSFHGGAEGASNQHVPKRTETYYGENRGDVHEFAHAVIDAGADIVFGHGPHVTRAAELYKDRFIIYSLGNFCTYGRFNVTGVSGVAPIISLEIDETGAFVSGQIRPIYQAKTHGPKLDKKKQAIKILQDLTKADFPNTELLIEANGNMTKRK